MSSFSPSPGEISGFGACLRLLRRETRRRLDPIPQVPMWRSFEPGSVYVPEEPLAGTCGYSPTLQSSVRQSGAKALKMLPKSVAKGSARCCEIKTEILLALQHPLDLRRHVSLKDGSNTALLGLKLNDILLIYEPM